MKKHLIIFCLLTYCCCMFAHQYAPSSRLKDGHLAKICIRESGVYLITYDDIVSAGLNPQKTGILGFGGALLTQDFSQKKIDDVPPVAVYRHLGDDGQFNKGDYILFYGQGPINWTYNGSRFTHTINHCSNFGYYFLSDAEGALLEMPIAEAIDSTGSIPQDWYTNYQLHEMDWVNLIDPDRGAEGGGREFYGEQIHAGKTFTTTFQFSNVKTDVQGTCYVTLAAKSAQISKFQVSVDDAQRNVNCSAIPIKDNYLKATLGTATFDGITPANQMQVTIKNQSTDNTAKGYLNYIEMAMPCSLKLQDSHAILCFRSERHLGTHTKTQFQISGATDLTEIWDVTKLDSIQRIPTYWQDGLLTFCGDNSSLHEYVAVTTQSGNYLRPIHIEKIQNQDLHSLNNIDLVIITPKSFQSEAERLGEAHWQNDGLSYAVVTDQEVYNEFSSGTPDVSAIRWMMKMLYDRSKMGQSTAPQYLLLFGDGTFDNRKLLNFSGKNTLITYQASNSTEETKAYATDDYFAFLEDADGMYSNRFLDTYGTMRIGVGRLPINTLTEAQNVVDKIIAYMENRSLGRWKQQLSFLADDGDHNQHTSITDAAAERVRTRASNYVINKIYLDAYPQEKTASTESYPIAYNRFTNLLKAGVLFMDYTGHGGPNNICSEQFLTLASVQAMQNKNQGFWMMATCNYAHFDTEEPSSAEVAVLNPKGGAIGVLSACRTVYASENSILNKYFCDTLIGQGNPFVNNITLGKATQIAKNQCGKRENKLPYILLGDPALRLCYPTGMEVITSSIPDTLRALGVIQLAGYIRNQNGDTVNDFNGTLEIAVYDKLQSITTRDNDEPDPSKKVLFTYNDYSNLLFSGSADIVDGKFKLEFRLPKDIQYNFGNGRIVYYAADPLNEWEATGHNHDIIIGGSDPSSIHANDTIGPELHIYLDNPAFVDGGKTSEYPHFYADISDENGINTVGNGIGHDLILMVDNDYKQSYSLNEYYTSNSGSYQSGQVSYPMPLQKAGQHFLTFKAWDLFNNSSIAHLSYQVVEGLSPIPYAVRIYPNPCTPGQPVCVDISTDRPDEILNTSMEVYSINGQCVLRSNWSEDRTIYFVPAQANMTPGIYVIRLTFRTESSSTTKSLGKLIVL